MNLPDTISFKAWILQDHENRWVLVLSAIFSLTAFTWLKICYPFPNFLPDSYSYLDAAFKNQSINLWPIGYSKFLRIFSCFTRSDMALVFVQYILLQASILYFLLTVRYLLAPGRWLFRILFVCCLMNPLTMYLCNFISSDALFASLSLIWITQILWILHRPNLRILLLHGVVLLFAFMVRYNALFYPFISLAVILQSRLILRTKLIGISCMAMLTGGFVLFNVCQYKTFTDTTQFSAFGGWQLASNALYGYAHSRPDAPDQVPSAFRDLQVIVNRHMDSVNRLPHRPDAEPGIYYLWDEHAPLKQYLGQKWKKDSVTDGFKKWASMGPLYGAYGSWLIRRHPADFIQYYLWPNIENYYGPGAEFMSIYNMGSDSVEDLAKFWFNLSTRKVKHKEKKIIIAEAYPTMLAIINPLFFLGFIGFWLSNGFKRSGRYFLRSLRWIAIIWLANFGFSVLASPIVLRYQVFPVIITVTFLGFLVEGIVRLQSPPPVISTGLAIS